jgi:hypothetical protein
VPVTQEAMSLLIGVRRTTVSLINTKLERDAVTRTRRGMVTIFDRAALAQRSCECYQALVDSNSALYGQDVQSAVPENFRGTYAPTPMVRPAAGMQVQR